MSLPTPERWRTLEPLLDRLFESPQSDWPDVAASMANAHPECGEDLLALAAAVQTQGLLDHSVQEYVEQLCGEDDPSLIGTRVGAWRIRAEVGQGGMGIVYLADRADGSFEQEAAMKVLRRGIDTDEVLARFRRERQILARLEHPHIARLLDGGATDDGRPYLVMEYIVGAPIVEWCDARNVPLERRLRLFLDVCGAVAHAHRRLVVHRDLKPSNILVKGAGDVKLLDFGIAKLLGAGDAEEGVTRIGRRVLTPRYAAPEQVSGQPITTATDTYALGLVLYELLVGRGPFRLSSDTHSELERAVMEGVVELPSARLAADRAVRLGTTTDRLRRDLRGDLDSVLLTALRKEPDRRYPSAESLARDIERHLQGLPVSARPDTLAYRTRKFIRRHGMATATGAMVTASLLAGLAAVSSQGRQARRERDRAARVSEFLVDLFAAPHPIDSGGRNVTAREIVDRGAERIERELGADPELQGQLAGTMARVYFGLGLLDRASLLYTRSIEHWRRAEGFEGAATLAASNGLANTLVRDNRLGEGLSLFEGTLEKQRRLLGPGHGATLATMNDLAFWYGETGRHGDAARLVRQVLDQRREALGAEHYDTLWSANDLAVAYVRVGRYDDAVLLLEPAIAAWWRTVKRTPDTFLDNLADAYRGQGRLPQARRALEEVLDYRRRVLGPDHSQTLVGLRSLASLQAMEGSLAESEALHRSTLAGLREVRGEEHFETLASKVALAEVLLKQGRLDEAERELNETLAVERRVLPRRHPSLAAAVYGLACVESARGHDTLAMATLGRAIDEGYANAAWLARDPALSRLRGRPDFASLESRARLNAGAALDPP